MTTLGLVLVIPAACLGGILAYGRALSEAQAVRGPPLARGVARGRRRFARRFAAMSPAEHLEAASKPRHRGYDRELGLGVEARGVTSTRSPRRPRARRGAGPPGQWSAGRQPRSTFHRRFDEVLRGADDASEAEAWDQRAARIGLAHALDRFSGHGLSCVHTEASWARVLRFDHPACDRAWLDQMVGPRRLAGLRSFGFTAVRCGNDSASIALGAGR
ncbi:MAG: hypothetical protein U0326_05860 [Polyangiales bacterium]